MATVNKALKKRAQAFAEKHELPYLRALKAVDEPLHQLRDLLDFKEISRAGYFPGLRLAEAEDRRVSPYAKLIEDEEPWKAYAKLVARRELSRFDFSADFYIELGKRISLIEETHSGDIWRYRELYRAGLLSEDSPYMEPFFHHFSTEFTWGAESAFLRAFQTGIVGVSIASAADYDGSKSLIPVTEEELESLKRGNSIEKIELSQSAVGPDPQDPAAFYKLQEIKARSEAWMEREFGDNPSGPVIEKVWELFESLMGESRIEREWDFISPIVRDLVTAKRATVTELLESFLIAQNETARKLGKKLQEELENYQESVSQWGIDEITGPTKERIDKLNEFGAEGKPYFVEVPEAPSSLAKPKKAKVVERASAVDILNTLGVNDDELRSAREEVALEKARDSMVQDMNSLCSRLISSFDRDFEANHKLVRDFALGELDENGGANFLAGIIRTLRGSDSLDARRIGARLIDGLATLDDADEETSDEVHAIISSMKLTATRIDEMSGLVFVAYP